MASTTRLAALFFPFSLAACSSQPIPINPLVLYDKKEEIKLSYCADLANSSYYVARLKQQGEAKQEVIKRYAVGSSAQIRLNLIEDVFRSDDDENSWQYGTQSFEKCAEKIANVKPARSEIALLCGQKTMVAGGAYEDRRQGKEKLDAYFTYAAHKSLKPFEVIDWVYNANADETLEFITRTTWQRCIRIVAE